MKRFSRFVFAATAVLTLSAAQMVAQNTTPTTTDQDKTMDAQHQRHMQRGKMGRRAARAHMQRMGTELGLSDAQKTQLKSIHEQERTKAEEIRANPSLTKEQKMEQMKALRESTHSQLNGILTAEQQTKFQTMQQNHKEHMGRHGKRGRHGAGDNKTENQKPESTQK